MMNPLLERILPNVPTGDGTIECDIDEEHLDCSLMDVLVFQNENYVFSDTEQIEKHVREQADQFCQENASKVQSVMNRMIDTLESV